MRIGIIFSLALNFLLAAAAAESVHVEVDASGLATSGLATAATLPKETHLLVIVDDVLDKSTSDGAMCQPELYPESDGDLELMIEMSGSGKCSLRCAIELANERTTIADIAATHFTIALRPGRYRINSMLPEVLGSIGIVGSAGLPGETAKLAAGNEIFKPGSIGVVDSEKRDAAPQPDPGFYDRPKGKNRPPGYHQTGSENAGQISSIATIIDGQNKVQILRVARGASLALNTVRVLSGVALGGTGDDDPRSALGGCICSQGSLRVDNVAMMGCRAVFGGGLYSEGSFEARFSEFKRNEATRCGGFLYAAQGGKANFEKCNLSYNQDHCGRGALGNDLSDSGTKLLESRGKLSRIGGGPSGGEATSKTSDEIVQALQKKGGVKSVDVSGVVAEGPRLTRDSAEKLARMGLPTRLGGSAPAL